MPKRKVVNKIAYDALSTVQAQVTKTASFTSAAVPVYGQPPRTGLFVKLIVTAIVGAAQFVLNYAEDGVDFNLLAPFQTQNGNGWVSAPGEYFVPLAGFPLNSVPDPGGVFNPSIQLQMVLGGAGSGSSSSQSTTSSSSSGSGVANTVSYSAQFSFSLP